MIRAKGRKGRFPMAEGERGLRREVERLKRELERLASEGRERPPVDEEALSALLDGLGAALLVGKPGGTLSKVLSGPRFPWPGGRVPGPGAVLGEALPAELAEALARIGAEAEATGRPAEARAPAGGGGRPWRARAVRAGAGRVAWLVVAREPESDEALGAGFRLAFDNAPIGMALVAPDERFLLVNQALCEMLGYTAEELLQMRVADVTDPEDVEEEALKKLDLIEGRAGGFSMIKRYRHKSGRTIVGRLCVSVVRDAGGRPAFYVGQLEDVTEREALRRRLFQAEKMESLGRLAAGVAHDFNNLLTVILGGCELLEEELARRGVPAHDLEAIRQAGLRAKELTGQLLAIARRRPLRPRPIDLNEVVRGAESLLRRVLGEKVRLQIDLTEPVWTVEADPAQLQQVILNLAINARDAMPEGGELRLRTANVTLGDGPPGAGRFVELTVEDTGPGLPPEVRRHLFEPFVSTKSSREGTGLGLATIYGIVRQSGGDVTVDSDPGKGTRFRIRLPGSDKPPEPEAPPEPILPGRREGKGRVLLVEDDAGVRDLAARTLRAAGYEVAVADGPAAARRLAGAGRPVDLLIADLVLPEGRATDLAAELRRDRPGLPVLFITGYADEGVAGEGSAEALLPKPFTPSELLVHVRRALERAQDRR
ncbi:MAG: PAS domain S-box protein [Acidobacteria bacterium]|nr:MAG: PAS domain S-box protein [Acidobacteriota bacterium]